MKTGLLLVIVILATSCETNRWEEHEQKLINIYIESLEDTLYVKYPSGLYYIELLPGTGAFPENGDVVYFKYKAAFTDYVQFDSNKPYTSPYRYVIGEMEDVVSGVDEGLRYIREGGTSRLLTPSNLAWGFEGIPGIVAGYTPIVWTIELDSIQHVSGK